MSDICFTINNYSPQGIKKLRALTEKASVEYLVWAREVGDKGTPHIQGFVQFNKKVTFTSFNRMLKMKQGGEYARCEQRRGAPEDAAGYCMKGKSELDKETNERWDPEPDGDECTEGVSDYRDFLENPGVGAKFEVFGEIVQRLGQGARTDLHELIAAIKDGTTTADEIAVTHPELHRQYGRTFEKAEDFCLRKRFRTVQTTCTWYHGPTGVGKSHAAFQNYDPATTYLWNLEEDFQDGYTGQETVIINEFRGGRMRYSRLLDLIDKWPAMVKRKGRGPAPFLAKHVIITSCYTPEEAYASLMARDSIDQLLRRVEVIELSPREQKITIAEEDPRQSEKSGQGNNGPDHPRENPDFSNAPVSDAADGELFSVASMLARQR